MSSFPATPCCPNASRTCFPCCPPICARNSATSSTSAHQGTGSGVIVTEDGYILTNNHVVGNASDITVTLNDGRVLKAQRVGTDPKSDLAVIRIKADRLVAAHFGDSDRLKVGDWVLAFGSPFGLSQTMTQGIISAIGRHVPIIADHDPGLRGMTYENFLQTDAAINPGNSGGPLVNLHGDVVGINAAIASQTGTYTGIGFSIPSNDARFVMRSLIDNGKVVRGWVGIIIEDLDHPTPEHQPLADALHKQGATSGVLVGKVTANGPAAKAGLKPGDLITAFDARPSRTLISCAIKSHASSPIPPYPLPVSATPNPWTSPSPSGLSPTLLRERSPAIRRTRRMRKFVFRES